MMAKSKTPFAVNKEGDTLYVKLKYSGIHPLVAMFDGISLTHFGNEKTAYLKVQQAINWHEKELRESKGTAATPKCSTPYARFWRSSNEEN